MGTGVTPSLWSPTTSLQALTLIKERKIDCKVKNCDNPVDIMSEGKSFVKNLEKMPKVDALAVGALLLNIYVVFTTANLSIQDLTEPMGGDAVTVIQASALVAAIYIIEYMGDEEQNSRGVMPNSSSESEGLAAWIADMAEGSKVVDALSIGAVYLGYSYISQNADYGTSITEISTEPEVLAMQLSVLMMLNFGIFLISDLMNKSS